MVKVAKKQISSTNQNRTNYYRDVNRFLYKVGRVVRTATTPSTYHKQINNIFRLNPSRRQNGWRDLSPIDIDVDRYDNPCNKSVQAAFRAFIWRMRTIELFQRARSCRLNDSSIEPYSFNTPITPECKNEGRVVYIWWLQEKKEYTDYIKFNREHTLFWELLHTTSTIDKVEFPVDEFINGYRIYAVIEWTIFYTFTANHHWDYNRFQVQAREFTREFKEKRYILYRVRPLRHLGNSGQFGTAGAGQLYTNYSAFLAESSRFRDSFRRVTEFQSDELNYKAEFVPNNAKGIAGNNTTPYRNGSSFPVSFYYDALGFKVVKFETGLTNNLEVIEQRYVALTFCEDGKKYVSEPPPGGKKKPPPPPPPKMRCCPDNSALLRKILKIVKQNKEAIGYDDFPASLPASLITKDGKEPGNKNVTNIPRLITYFLERFDEVVGEFEIPIEIEDTDLIKEGNQSLTVKLPNIAEAIAEMFMMAMNLNIVNEVQINAITRILAETGADKQQNLKSYMMLEAIVEHLGFSYDDKTIKLPLTYTPGAESLQEILQEKEVDVSCIEYNDDINLPKQMHELLQSAAIIRARFWKRIDTKGDIKQQLLGTILQNTDLIERFTKGINLDELQKEINNIKDEQDKV